MRGARDYSRLSAFFRFSPPAPFATAARFTAFVPPDAGCTPTATLASAVPSGEGETCRSFDDALLPADRDGGVPYVFGVDGCSGWEVEGGFADTGGAALVVAAFGAVGAAATGVEEVAGEGVEDVEADADADAEVDGSEGVSDFEGVLNSTGRTWRT